MYYLLLTVQATLAKNYNPIIYLLESFTWILPEATPLCMPTLAHTPLVFGEFLVKATIESNTAYYCLFSLHKHKEYHSSALLTKL